MEETRQSVKGKVKEEEVYLFALTDWQALDISLEKFEGGRGRVSVESSRAVAEVQVVADVRGLGW